MLLLLLEEEEEEEEDEEAEAEASLAPLDASSAAACASLNAATIFRAAFLASSLRPLAASPHAPGGDNAATAER